MKSRPLDATLTLKSQPNPGGVENAAFLATKKAGDAPALVFHRECDQEAASPAADLAGAAASLLTSFVSRDLSRAALLG